MNRCYLIISVLVGVLGASPVLKADTTYYLVPQLVETGIVSGSITTDGTTGTQGFIQIDSFSFGVTRTVSSGNTGGATGREMGKTASVSEIGSGLTATPTGLYFNFDDVQQSALIFRNALDGFEWCIFTDEGCDPPGSGEFLSLGTSSDVVTGLSGDVLIASTAPMPEPGTLGLLLIGIAGLMFLMRNLFLPASLSGVNLAPR